MVWNKDLHGEEHLKHYKKKKVWNEGLTKETDERVKKYSKSNEENYKNNPNRIIQSQKSRRLTFEKHPELKKIANLHHSQTLQNNPEIRNKIGIAHKGENSPSKRIEVRRKIANTIIGTEASLETRKKRSAKLQGIELENWTHFITIEPYDEKFNVKFKKEIRKRDNNECIKCGVHQEKLSYLLSVHHINYDKLLTIPENCCSLCNRCHAEVNTNRIHWIKFFHSLLSEKYGYKYSENSEIILNFNNRN